jgi:hypothetical protein
MSRARLTGNRERADATGRPSSPFSIGDAPSIPSRERTVQMNTIMKYDAGLDGAAETRVDEQ